MIVTKKKENSNIGLYLLLCILLNYLLLSYLLTPHVKLSPIEPFEPMKSIRQDSEIKLSAEIKTVPALSQLPLLPTGCEAAATAMFLQWAGIDVSMAEIANLLPKGPLPSEQNGKIIGGNPSYEFVGDPFSTTGLGVYNKPIFDAINHYIPNQAQNITGCSFEDLIAVLSSERPIVVWATINMKEPTLNAIWQDNKGQEVVWMIPEHAMVLVGFSESEVFVNDPLKGKKVTYDKATFKKCWEGMGSQAITVIRDN